MISSEATTTARGVSRLSLSNWAISLKVDTRRTTLRGSAGGVACAGIAKAVDFRLMAAFCISKFAYSILAATLRARGAKIEPRRTA